MNISIEQLRITVTVARFSSFSASARSLNLTQPAITRAIHSVESIVGARLFERTTRSVTTTPEGEQFLSVAEEIVRNYDQGLDRFAAARRAESGTLTIAALPVLASGFLAPILARFLRDRPDVRVRLLTGTATEILEMLARGDAHAAVTERPSRHDDFEVVSISTDPLIAAVPESHTLAAAASATWQDFARYPFVQFEEGTSVRRLTDEGFTRAGARPDFSIVVDATEAAIGLLSAGLGITALPRSARPLLGRSGVRAISLHSPVVSRELAALVPRTPPPAPLVRAFIDVVRTISISARDQEREDSHERHRP